MSESIHEQVAAAIKANLAAIVGDGGVTYWFTPDAVLRTVYFNDLAEDPSVTTVYLIRPGIETIEEESTGSMAGKMEVWILVAQRYQAATENPYIEASPTRWQIANRMIRDVIRKLFIDVQLGGLLENVAIEPTHIDRERFLPSWALAEIRFMAKYSFVNGVTGP